MNCCISGITFINKINTGIVYIVELQRNQNSLKEPAAFPCLEVRLGEKEFKFVKER